MIYSEKIDEIHTFDSKYKNVIFKNNNILIPYFNIGISNHPLHPQKKGMTFLDYCYMVFENVSFLKIYIEGNKDYIVIDSYKKNEVYYFGGEYLDVNEKIFNDLQICCDHAYLQTLDFTKLSDTMWVLSAGSNPNENVQHDFLLSFFAHEYLPNNLKILVKEI